jgi:hypothetical protein
VLAVPVVALANKGYKLVAVVVSIDSVTDVPDETVAQDVLVPSVVKYLPELVAWLGANALNAVLAVVCPVPPEVMAKVTESPAAGPVVFWLNVGQVNVPVLKSPEVGVPRTGVTNVGLVANATTVPVPVVE